MFAGRKKYLIKKDFQARFIMRFMLVAIIWASTTVALFAFLAGRKLDDLRYSSHIDLQTTSELLLPITIKVQLCSLLIFAVILAYTIRALWRKFSQPLAALQRSIISIADGDLSYKVTLRKEDEFQDLAAELDEMRVGLRAKFIRIKEQQQALSAAAAELDGAIVDGKPVLSSLAALQAAVAGMKRGVSAFHLQAAVPLVKECVL